MFADGGVNYKDPKDLDEEEPPGTIPKQIFSAASFEVVNGDPLTQGGKKLVNTLTADIIKGGLAVSFNVEVQALTLGIEAAVKKLTESFNMAKAELSKAAMDHAYQRTLLVFSDNESAL